MNANALPNLLPINDSLALHTILVHLRVEDIFKLGMCSSEMKAIILNSNPIRMHLCRERGWNPCIVKSWIDMAKRDRCLLYEDFNGDFNWKRGPNLKCPDLNSTELVEGENCKWLRLSGGTDWQGFKGVYRTFEDEADHPPKHYWLEFELKVNDIDGTSICIVLSEGIRNWGPEGVIMQLVYDGHRTGWRFVLRQPPGMPMLRGSRRREVRVDDCQDRTTFTFLFFIDFVSKYVVFYSNGVLNGAMEFASDAKHIGALSIYSWRSQSELLISNIILTKFESSLRVAPCSTIEGRVDIQDHGSRNDPRILIRFLLFIALPVLAAMASIRLWSSIRYIL